MMLELYLNRCSDGWALSRELEDVPHITFEQEDESRE